MTSDIDFRVLGPLVVRCADDTIEFNGNRQQTLLSMLLVEANRIVTIDRLVDAVWGEDPPVSARSQIRICVSQIRRKLADHGHGGLIETHYGSYLIRVPPPLVDLYRFEEYAVVGRKAAQQGDLNRAAHYLRMALEQWGAPLPSASGGNRIRSLLVKLDEDRSTVAEEYIVTMLDLGRHREIVGELSWYATEFPYRESITAQLMLALFRSGRKADALDLYRQTRRRFVAELGIEPGPELRTVEQFILNSSRTRQSDEVRAPAYAGGVDFDDRLQTLERELLEMRVGLDRLIRATESRPPSR